MHENMDQTATENNGDAVKLFSASRNDLSQLRQVAKEAAKDVRDRVSNHAGRAKQHWTHLVSNARSESGTHLGEIKVKATQIKGQAIQVVARRPIASFAVALIAGAIFGFVLRRGKKATL